MFDGTLYDLVGEIELLFRRLTFAIWRITIQVWITVIGIISAQ